METAAGPGPGARGGAMGGEFPPRIRSLCQELGVTAQCRDLLAWGLPAEDLLATLERIHGWRRGQGRRRWNLHREVINTIRHESRLLRGFLSTEIAERRSCLATLGALYTAEPLNYRDRLILLTKYLLAQINPLGNAEMRAAAEAMIRDFIRHPDPGVREATFRGITFEVARLRQKGGGWYVQPLVDLLADVLREDPALRAYIREESMEVYYTAEQRDVVDEILVAVALGLGRDRPEGSRCD